MFFLNKNICIKKRLKKHAINYINELKFQNKLNLFSITYEMNKISKRCILKIFIALFIEKI